jgi:hypothetical protein
MRTRALATPAQPTSNAAFQLPFDHYPTPMWVYDARTPAILDVNNAALKKYGSSRKRFVGITISVRYTPTERPRLMALLKWKHPSFQDCGQHSGQHPGVWKLRRETCAIDHVEVAVHNNRTSRTSSLYRSPRVRWL